MVQPRATIQARDRSRAETLFLLQLETIDGIIASVSRRNCLFGAEADDFASWAKLKLIESDYAVLRRHRGDSKLSTYLTVVIANLFRDFRIQRWGRWRPSAKARRLGQEAIQLETLLYRDGFTLHEAIEILRRNFGVARSRSQLSDLAAVLPRRMPRVVVGEDRLETQTVAADAEERLADRQRAATVVRIQEVLNSALEELSTEDRLVLKMHYRDGLTLAAIAASLDLDQRRLYTRREKCIRVLRACFKRKGLGWGEVRTILGWEGTELRGELAAGVI
jgi:RNA polymerase sigma factor for flagellar operon FliA